MANKREFEIAFVGLKSGIHADSHQRLQVVHLTRGQLLVVLILPVMSKDGRPIGLPTF